MATTALAKPTSPWSGRASLVLALGLWGSLIALFWPFTQDDSYILYRYARNWAEGHHLVYNFPGVPVDGYTSFAWTLLLGVMARLGLPWDLDVSSKVLGTVLGIATLLIVRKLPDFAEHAAPTRWTALLLTAVAPPMIVGTIDGLETPLYVLVQMALVWCWVRDMRRERHSVLCGLLGGLLTLVRPDGVLLRGLLVGASLWMRRTEGHARLPRLLPIAAGFALIFLPYFIWHFRFYGHPLPNTFYVKSGGHPDQLFAGLLKISAALKESGGWATIMIVVLAFVGRSSPYRLALSAVIVSRALFTVWSGGEVMGHHRFFAPALPAYFLLFQLGMDQLDQGFAVARADWSRSWSRRVFRLAPLIIVAYTISRPLLDTRRESLQYTEGMQRAHIRLGHDLAREARAGARMAIGDAGAAPYYSGLYNIDILGLNDEYLAHLPGRYTQKIDVDYVMDQRPDYIVVVSREPPEKGFVPEYGVDQALQTAIARSSAYSLWRVYQFKDHYFLWVYHPSP